MAVTIYSIVRPAVALINQVLRLEPVQGLEHLPASGAFILAGNHVSMPDAWFMGSLTLQQRRRKVWFIARDQYWFNRQWTAWVSKFLCALLIDWRRPAAILATGQARLAGGDIVGIFPEGSRNFDPRTLMLGKTGVVRLALLMHCPIIPVGYSGPKITKVRDIISYIIRGRTQATITFGAPIDLSPYYHQPITRQLLYQLTDNVMVEIGKLCHKRPRLHTY